MQFKVFSVHCGKIFTTISSFAVFLYFPHVYLTLAIYRTPWFTAIYRVNIILLGSYWYFTVMYTVNINFCLQGSKYKFRIDCIEHNSYLVVLQDYLWFVVLWSLICAMSSLRCRVLGFLSIVCSLKCAVYIVE